MVKVNFLNQKDKHKRKQMRAVIVRVAVGLSVTLLGLVIIFSFFKTIDRTQKLEEKCAEDCYPYACACTRQMLCNPELLQARYVRESR
jgi:hypothetical protein